MDIDVSDLFNWINWYQLHKFTRPKRLPAFIAFISSCIIALAGFTLLAQIGSLPLNLYTIIYTFLGLLFFLSASLSMQYHLKKSIRVFVFSLILLLIALITTLIDPITSLHDFGLSAGLSDQFLFSLGFVIFGLIGTSFSLQMLYDFSPIGNQQGAYLFLVVSILFVLYPLVIVISQVVINGAPGISLDFFTQEVQKLGNEGGILNPLIGTLLLMLIMFFVAVPLGVGAAIYLEEYAGGGIIVRAIKTSVSILRGVPSIVFGLFALTFFAQFFGLSLLTGALTLSVYALPVIIRTSSETLKTIPMDLREGSYALGATKWQTIRHIVLPPATPGVLTGVVLGIGEAAGETAPILFFGRLAMSLPPNVFGSLSALPTHLYSLFGLRGYGAYKEDIMQNAWSTALVLLIIILAMNIIALFIREKFRQEF